MHPILVILAAGMGSRYGGLKQMDTVGPHGQTILDYSIYDAHRAGFGEIVFIIRRDFADVFRERMGRARSTHGLDLRYVIQDPREMPAGFMPSPGREKPWGTAHAVWSARKELDRPFAVVNADDFYGADSFRRLAGFLTTPHLPAHEFALVGFRLGRTLSEHGTVSRGVCQVDDKGMLVSIVEQTALERDPATGGARGHRPDGSLVNFPADTTVSMNCWGLTPGVLPQIEAQLSQFLRAHSGDLKAECYLPGVIGKLLALGQAHVRVLPTEAQWCGVTYQQDKLSVHTMLKALHDSGEYPEDFKG
jgi:dTDP-glucose pyrophosphorylase